MLTTAYNTAAINDDETITEAVVERVIARRVLFPLGLTEIDVRILELLADRTPRGMGMTELCRATGISASQFSGLIEPYLRLLGFVETPTRRVIATAGIAYLASIKVDRTRPEIRAVSERGEGRAGNATPGV